MIGGLVLAAAHAFDPTAAGVRLGLATSYVLVDEQGVPDALRATVGPGFRCGAVPTPGWTSSLHG